MAVAAREAVVEGQIETKAPAAVIRAVVGVDDAATVGEIAYVPTVAVGTGEDGYSHALPEGYFRKSC